MKRTTLGLAAVIFFLLCLLPTLYMFAASFIDSAGGFGLENYRRLLMDERQRSLLLDSLLLGAGTAALATCMGVPAGMLLARANLRAKGVLRVLLLVPLVIPPYIMGLAWVYIGGAAGVVARITGRDILSNWTYSLTGAIVVLALCFYPLSMLATEAAARRVAAHLEEAGLLVASSMKVLWRITLPLMSPAIIAAALVIFVLALSEFGVPSLLRVPVFTTEVFTAFAALYDFGKATALAVPLLAIAGIAGIAVKVFGSSRIVTGRRSGPAGLRFALGHWRLAAGGWLMALVVVSVALPVAVLAREVGTPGRIVDAVRLSTVAIGNSLILSFAGATVIVLLAILLGYGVGRMRHLCRNVSEVALLVAFAVPSTVVGIGLIDLWNRPGLPGEVYRSPVMIVLGYLVRFTPVAALILAAAVRQIPTSFEEAASVAGAPWGRAFVKIVVPQLGAAFAGAWVVSFIFAFGELGATVLVSPPGASTLPVHVYTMIANAPSSQVAALALMQVAIVVTLLALLSFFVRREDSNP